jgi:Signal transduction histidine kinase regulating citrate/malate metabolism
MWIYSVLEYNFIHFPTELIISEIIFLMNKQRKEHFLVRLIGAQACYFLLAYGWMNFIEGISENSLIPVIFLYLGYAVLTVLPILCCFEIQTLELLFVIVGGYATQHMCFAILRIILYTANHSLKVHGFLHLATQYFTYILWAFIIYFLFVRKNQDKDDFKNEDVRIAVFALVLALAAIVLSAFYSESDEMPNIYSGVICPAYGILCCAMILIMEYYVLRENRLKREQEMMEQLLQMADGQQKSAEAAINIINIKCHDLKHQIRALAKMEDAAARSEYLKEVQQAVSIYDATYHTGNRALDYILREKSLMFNEHNVEFSCMVEGKTMGFMSTPDIYALMGNALDNALEQVLQEAEGERIISLQIKKNGGMVLVHLENRCSHEPEFRDGLPVTDKREKEKHGFGVKSIRYIAEKYHGELFMAAKDGKFYLDILFAQKSTE